jgi:hypothetical protein
MKKIIKKLEEIQDETEFNSWSLEDIQKLLKIYLIISKKEEHIFNLIYRYQGCDSWEDIFRDYDINYLQSKTDGVEVAINEINEMVEQTETNNTVA